MKLAPSGAWRGVSLAVGAALLAAGCAQPPKAPAMPDGGPPRALWTGRLALQVLSEPPRYSSAAFELKGDARTGELSLFSPLGGTLAVMAWAPGSATLRNGSGPAQTFESVDALVTRATGTAVPVAALFDWLGGTPTPVQGWQPDLSRRAEGRIAARRTEPAPPVQLRVVLDETSATK